VPSGFSPNNDGINDVFSALHSETINEGAIEIYDRWGELVYKSDSLDFAWDGTRKGIPLLEDVYFYRLTYFLYENFSETVQGTITIYR
jgi:gliding motility-associated-like protein